MTTKDDVVFMVARAMARHDGHDPDQKITSGEPYRVRGYNVTYVIGQSYPIWHLYTGLAHVAIDEVHKLLGSAPPASPR